MLCRVSNKSLVDECGGLAAARAMLLGNTRQWNQHSKTMTHASLISVHTHTPPPVTHTQLIYMDCGDELHIVVKQ